MNFNELFELIASQQSVILGGLVGVFGTLAIQAFTNHLSFKRENIKELKKLTRQLIKSWSKIRSAVIKISTYRVLMKDIETTDQLNNDQKITELNKYSAEIFNQETIISEEYYQSHNITGQLYLFFSNYHFQNQLEDLFLALNNEKWSRYSWHAAHNRLYHYQVKGIYILNDLKKDIDCLSSPIPLCIARPIKSIKVTGIKLYLDNYEKYRKLKYFTKKSFRRSKAIF